jgi:hypothetical protein
MKLPTRRSTRSSGGPQQPEANRRFRLVGAAKPALLLTRHGLALIHAPPEEERTEVAAWMGGADGRRCGLPWRCG